MQTERGHITYCTNIHAGESWPDHFAAIQANFPAIKNELSPAAPMGIGLRLSDLASKQLAAPGQLEIFKVWLQQNNAYVFTMNGFPYGGFHDTVVKENVHAPDWLSADRVAYTKRLFDILVELLPEGMDGGVSTSPLSYRYWFATDDDLQKATRAATKNILDVAKHLNEIYNATGKVLHLDIEPEPDGILETGDEFLAWYQHNLLQAGVEFFSNEAPGQAAEIIKRHITLCYDVCHFAIGYEQHQEMVAQLKTQGIGIGKFQISAALKAVMPGGEKERGVMLEAFSTFNEPTYLHQVIARTKSGGLLRYRDLPQALSDGMNKEIEEWRAHFHVPVFEENLGALQSTQSDIKAVLQLHKQQQLTNHLEVETYTWDVLSPALKLPMQPSITRELKWLLNQLA